MPMYSILHRWTRTTMAVIEAPTHARAIETAARQGMSLVDVDFEGIKLPGIFLPRADLRGANLRNTDLSGAYLRKSDLRGATLQGAKLSNAFLRLTDLRQADLREVRMDHADLRGAKLVGADLRGTVMTRARLDDTLLDWRWSAVPCELIRKAPATMCDPGQLLIDLAFHEDSHPYSWVKLLVRGDSFTGGWACKEFSCFARKGDNAPEIIRVLTDHRHRPWGESS